MNLIELVKELDQMVVEGRYAEAVHRFFMPDVHTVEFDGKRTNGKIAKLQEIRTFADSIQKGNHASVVSQTVNGDVTMTEYAFDFSMKDGSEMRLAEVVRRQWKDGKVLSEHYYQGALDENDREEIPHYRSVNYYEKFVGENIPDNDPNGLVSEIHVYETGVADDIRVAVDISHTFIGDLVIKLESPSHKLAFLHGREGGSDDNIQKTFTGDIFNAMMGDEVQGVWKLIVEDRNWQDKGKLNWWGLELHSESNDDLSRIEGIGPKIAELLKAAHIRSFAKLAITPLETLESILDAAGGRFELADPGTWAEQASLAAEGRWAELDALQKELVGGKRVEA
jgi:subtilisin-like proprotein convertase family protein